MKSCDFNLIIVKKELIMNDAQVIVIGAGIAGLSVAWQLKQSDIQSDIEIILQAIYQHLHTKKYFLGNLQCFSRFWVEHIL